ncbi:MAG TPA: hypothetical protein PLS38_05445, partial [Solirubrobacterales bacterium]|nr:hypothetical protein [Solirubrobacterales bacterium]
MIAERVVRPVAPLRMPRLVGGDLVFRLRGPWLERLLILSDEAMIVRVREAARGEFVFAAEPVDPALLEGPGSPCLKEAGEPALEEGISRLRFSLGVDDDLAGFRNAFREDPLLGRALNGRLQYRPMRRPVAWEALLWAITEQLIEYSRAARIQRQLIRRFGVGRILLAGALLLLACVGVTLAGVSVMHFWAGLLLLGVGWNFLYIGGTTLLTETHRPEERAKVQGGNDFLVFAVQG